MQTRVSSKGQIVLPAPLRAQARHSCRRSLDIAVEKDRIVLTPPSKPKYQARIVEDPVTGFTAIDLGPMRPSSQVKWSATCWSISHEIHSGCECAHRVRRHAAPVLSASRPLDKFPAWLIILHHSHHRDRICSRGCERPHVWPRLSCRPRVFSSE